MPKRPRDPNQLAKMVVDIATGELDDTVSESKRLSSKRGRAGGLKGGPARAKRLSGQQRSSIARRAAEKRWREEHYGKNQNKD